MYTKGGRGREKRERWCSLTSSEKSDPGLNRMQTCNELTLLKKS